ncbi:MAG: hypothetical protein J0H49_24600 [Acidobacteria bacterium]|nr:hypothetical protein [Acidobacteriota bacterium]
MPNKPSDIPSIRKLLDELEQLSTVKAAFSALKPMLSMVGVDSTALRDSFQSLEAVQKQAIDLAKTLDRFNELFASRGWIAYDWLNTDLAKAAVAAAEDGNMAHAENLLVEHYDAGQVAIQLKTLWGIKAFRPRLRLAELALTDYREGRYHACVPVVLALLDGMVNELGNLGFFSQNVDLIAWDSIASHDRGLTELKRLLFKQRTKTITDAIDLPYRNGILHGMDLAYDTRMVAAKCWAALFATADWARRIEKGKRDAPPPEPKPNWSDVLAEMQQVAKEKARIEAWKPRDAVDLANPVEGSPEAALISFLSAWKVRNYGVMARWLGAFDNRPLNTRAGQVRGYYEHLALREFMIEAVNDKAAAIAEIQVRGCGIQYGRSFDGIGTVCLVQMDEIGHPVVHGYSGGVWFVMNWNPWQGLCRPLDPQELA